MDPPVHGDGRQGECAQSSRSHWRHCRDLLSRIQVGEALNIDPYEYATAHLVWIDPTSGAQVFLGGEDGFTEAFLKENNVQVAISVNSNLSPEAQRVFQTVDHYHLPFHDAQPDKQEKGMRDNAGRAVLLLEQAIREGKNASVNCHAGIHRSPAVVYAALVRLGYFENRYDAYCHVSKIRGCARLYKGLAKWVEKAAEDVSKK